MIDLSSLVAGGSIHKLQQQQWRRRLLRKTANSTRAVPAPAPPRPEGCWQHSFPKTGTARIRVPVACRLAKPTSQYRPVRPNAETAHLVSWVTTHATMQTWCKPGLLGDRDAKNIACCARFRRVQRSVMSNQRVALESSPRLPPRGVASSNAIHRRALLGSISHDLDNLAAST